MYLAATALALLILRRAIPANVVATRSVTAASVRVPRVHLPSALAVFVAVCPATLIAAKRASTFQKAMTTPSAVIAGQSATVATS